MRRFAILLVLCPAIFAYAGQEAPKTGLGDSTLLTLDRIFAANEFSGQSYGPVHWLARQGGYATLQPSEQVKGAQDIIRIDATTGKREVLVSAAHLVPKGGEAPLTIEEFSVFG